jgi:hypothetical protein
MVNLQTAQMTISKVVEDRPKMYFLSCMKHRPREPTDDTLQNSIVPGCVQQNFRGGGFDYPLIVKCISRRTV